MSVTTSVCTLTTHVAFSPPLPAVVRFTSITIKIAIYFIHPSGKLKCPDSLQLFASRQNAPTPYSCSIHVKMPPLPTAVRFKSKRPHSLQLFASRQNAPTPYSCSLHVKTRPLPTAVRFTSKRHHSRQLFASRQNAPTPDSCSLHVKTPPLPTAVRFTSKCPHSLQLFTARGALQQKKYMHSRNVGKQAVGFAKRLCILSEATVLGLFGS